ncbi:hypothetical protein K523DRAFT_358144 [Schizophyllum commune Tattone D]|nr:hypothetical protein K523DRAFT_358144 [Schizophyllum commune Tattone D]
MAQKSGNGDTRNAPITIDIDSRENPPAEHINRPLAHATNDRHQPLTPSPAVPALANAQLFSASSGPQVPRPMDTHLPDRRYGETPISLLIVWQMDNSAPSAAAVRLTYTLNVLSSPSCSPKPRTRAMRTASRVCKHPCNSCVKAGTTCRAFWASEGCDECQYGKKSQRSGVPLYLRCSLVSRALIAAAAQHAAEVAWVKCDCASFEPERTPSSDGDDEHAQSEDEASGDELSDHRRPPPRTQALESPGSSSGLQQHPATLSHASPSPVMPTSVTPSVPLRRPRSPSSSPCKRARMHTKDMTD